MAFCVPEKYRVVAGPYRSTRADGNNGVFFIRQRPDGRKTAAGLFVIASDGEGWEHVSVSLSYRCPYWKEMSWIKSLFWSEEDTVIQYHPPKSEYVNNHPYCLHLWRPVDQEIPLPPWQLVGIKA